jgi:hypothetical protein
MIAYRRTAATVTTPDAVARSRLRTSAVVSDQSVFKGLYERTAGSEN